MLRGGSALSYAGRMQANRQHGRAQEDRGRVRTTRSTAYERDIGGVAPALVLTIDVAKGSLRCTGTLDRRTRHHVEEAVGELLVEMPSRIAIDVAHLTVADVDAANALAHVQRMVRGAGVRLRWQGLDSDHLRGILPLRFRARRPRWQPAESAALRVARLRHPSMMPPPA
jgi:ABC-type transporter Mla MlaB component